MADEADATRRDEESPTQMTWGGRFSAPPADTLLEFTRSVATDAEMWREDINGSVAHVDGLEAAGVVSNEEARALRDGLARVADEFESGVFEFAPQDEDIHMAIERRLTEIAGPAGQKLHSGRSRNDQVALDVRLVVIRRGRDVSRALLGLAGALVESASKAGYTLMSGYTHLQRAQPVLLAHHLMAHAWPLLRDVTRLQDAEKRASQSPLGAGAIAGSSLPIDPAVAAGSLGLDSVFANSIDAVSDRDVVAEELAALAIAQVHMSRLGEDLVLWTSEEFGFVVLDDAWSTGSSMMPQKKNPDVAELTRARSGRVIGNLVNVLTMLKGLPLAYNRDLQEDKPALFDSLSVVESSAKAMTGLVSTMSIVQSRLEGSARDAFATATDLAEELVRSGVPFREAHEKVGSLVARLTTEGRGLANLTPEEIADLFGGKGGVDAVRLSAGGAVAARSGHGSTGSAQVEAQIAEAGELISRLNAWASAG